MLFRIEITISIIYHAIKFIESKTRHLIKKYECQNKHINSSINRQFNIKFVVIIHTSAHFKTLHWHNRPTQI